MFVCIISVIETFAQGIMKYASKQGLSYLMLCGTVAYVTISFILYHLYSYENMAVINAWWNIVTSVTVTISGIWLFHERLKGADILGIMMVIMGAFFLSVDELFSV